MCVSKIRWHRDFIVDPIIHVFILNLYCVGEVYLEIVGDYFFYIYVFWFELAKLMRRHAGDERRHTVLYAKAIQSLQQPVVTPDLLGVGADGVYNNVVRRFIPVSFAIAPGDSSD